MELKRLYTLRKEKGLTQQQLAKELKMPQNTISRYESGERQVNIKNLTTIADYFDVSLDYLLERTENPKLKKS